MSNINPEGFSREDLLKILQRDRFVKEQLASRVANLVHENIELMGIIQELQADIAQLRQSSNGEVTTPVDTADIAS